MIFFCQENWVSKPKLYKHLVFNGFKRYKDTDEAYTRYSPYKPYRHDPAWDGPQAFLADRNVGSFLLTLVY